MSLRKTLFEYSKIKTFGNKQNEISEKVSWFIRSTYALIHTPNTVKK